MKKLYVILALVLFLLVGCADDTTSVDSGDTLCITEPVTSAVTEMVTEPETTEATEITEQTEAVDTQNDSSVPFTGYTSPWTPSDLPVVVQSAPDSTAPFRFAARMEKSEFSADETIVIRASLINNGEPFTTNLHTYFAFCVLIRELANGQYEELFVDKAIPDASEYIEIVSGKESIADHFFTPGHVSSTIKDADGTVLEESFPKKFTPGQYHLLFFYVDHKNNTEYTELYENCITIKDTENLIVLQSNPDSTVPFRFTASMEKSEYHRSERITINTTLINNGEPFTTNLYTYFANCALIRELGNGQYEKLTADILIPDGDLIEEIKTGQESDIQSITFFPRRLHSQLIDVDGTVLEESYPAHLTVGQYHLLLYYEKLIPYSHCELAYEELYSNCITITSVRRTE